MQQCDCAVGTQRKMKDHPLLNHHQQQPHPHHPRHHHHHPKGRVPLLAWLGLWACLFEGVKLVWICSRLVREDAAIKPTTLFPRGTTFLLDASGSVVMMT